MMTTGAVMRLVLVSKHTQGAECEKIASSQLPNVAITSASSQLPHVSKGFIVSTSKAPKTLVEAARSWRVGIPMAS